MKILGVGEAVKCHGDESSGLRSKPQPQSIKPAAFQDAWNARQRRGVRLSSAAQTEVINGVTPIFEHTPSKRLANVSLSRH